MYKPTIFEMCAGAGGQALGTEQAGFEHVGLVDNETHCINTLKLNRPNWNAIHGDLNSLDGTQFAGIDLLAGGLPCPPFSKAGKQLGEDDERNLFPAAIRLIDQMRPKSIMIENVRGILDKDFAEFRAAFTQQIDSIGYIGSWKLFNSSDFGVSQLRPRAIFVAFQKNLSAQFTWPKPHKISPPTVGEALYDLMAANGWRAVNEWRNTANSIAPTIVGGSMKHGGPDLGPTRAKREWEALGVNGKLIAMEAPLPDFVGSPYLTNRMVARLQGFPDDWIFTGKKTPAYRQIGNALPPPFARAIATQIHKCLANTNDYRLAS